MCYSLFLWWEAGLGLAPRHLASSTHSAFWQHLAVDELLETQPAGFLQQGMELGGVTHHALTMSFGTKY